MHLFAHVDDTANAVTSLHVTKGLVDLVEWLAVSDELVDLEATLQVVGYETGQLAATLDTAESASLPYTTSDKLEGTSGDLLTSSGNTNDDGLSPALVAGLESSAHNVDITRAVKGVVATAVGHLNEFLLDALVAELGGIDKVCGAELLCPLLLGVVDIDYDDHASLVLGGSLDD